MVFCFKLLALVSQVKPSGIILFLFCFALLALSEPMLSSNTEYECDCTICAVKCALQELNHTFADVKQRLIITYVPSTARSVRAKSSISPNSLTLVPVTKSVQVTKATSVPESAMVIRVDGQAIQLNPCYPTLHKAAQNDMQKDTKEFVVPFWCCETSTDMDACNCTFKIVSVNQGFQDIRIPCISNHKAICEHDRLVVFRGGDKKWAVPHDAPEEMLKKKARKSK